MTKTINDVYMELFRRFKEADDPQPSLAARELTAYACKADKDHTADWGHVYLDDATVDYAHLLCDRCLDGEPLAYLLGEWDFYGLTFQVDKNVLIPRSDTERLCELVIEQAQKKVSPRILDLCCGSGCIGIAAAYHVDDAHVAAVDNSEGALRVTRENARRLGVQSRFVAVNADVRLRRPAIWDGSISSCPTRPMSRAPRCTSWTKASITTSRTRRFMVAWMGWISTARSARTGVRCLCRAV